LVQPFGVGPATVMAFGFSGGEDPAREAVAAFGERVEQPMTAVFMAGVSV